VKLGDLTALYTFRRRGACSTGRQLVERALTSPLSESAVGGATDADDTLLDHA
jgi:hypothetical protein